MESARKACGRGAGDGSVLLLVLSSTLSLLSLLLVVFIVFVVVVVVLLLLLSARAAERKLTAQTAYRPKSDLQVT